MLNLTSLREQVYNFLRAEMHQGVLLPGTNINLNKLTEDLGISKTPLRDALIQLETEGFVEILPRRGVRVAGLTAADVKNLYEIIGSLEAGIIMDYRRQITDRHVDKLVDLNEKQRTAVREGDFESYYNLNLEFHGVYVNLSDNGEMKRWLKIMKQRLYDFPRRSYIEEWELSNCDEHDDFIAKLRQGDFEGAASVMRDVHWSFTVQKEPIKRFYSEVAKQIEADVAAQSGK